LLLGDVFREVDVVDVGAYCRLVEDHLTRVNAGHLVRIVGPAFELVRQWAEAGIPTSVVFRGIDLKAERHQAGRAKRPLRLEFCEPDVREVYRSWCRAVGLSASEAANGRASEPGTDDTSEPRSSSEPDDREDRRKPSLTRHLDRAIDRLTRAMARVDVPDGLREALDPLLQALVDLRTAAKGARGPAREDVETRLKPLDDELARYLREFVPAEMLESARREAELELSAYRGRLSGDAWPHAVAANADRLLRDRYGLPVL
jgi:hypothetical protein